MADLVHLPGFYTYRSSSEDGPEHHRASDATIDEIGAGLTAMSFQQSSAAYSSSSRIQQQQQQQQHYQAGGGGASGAAPRGSPSLSGSADASDSMVCMYVRDSP